MLAGTSALLVMTAGVAAADEAPQPSSSASSSGIPAEPQPAPRDMAPAFQQEGSATYYVSLGDSLASGYQPDVDQDTDSGYADQLYAMLKEREPGLQHIKLGCTGETTVSMLGGGTCSYKEGKSQLEAATAFLSQNKDKVRYVTLGIGANDFLRCIKSGTGAVDQDCLTQASLAVGKNLTEITSKLRKAGGDGPQYAGMTYYNPVLAAWLHSDAGKATSKMSSPLLARGNAGITEVLSAAKFKIADVAAAFSSGEFDKTAKLPGVGTVPLNVARLCQLTWHCGPEKDIHANPEGHKLIARTFAGVLSSGTESPNPSPSERPVDDNGHEEHGGSNESGGSERTAGGTTGGSTGGETGGEAGGLQDTPSAPTQDLAKTGSAGNTVLLTTIAGVVLAVGAAVMFTVRRRTSSVR